MVFTSLPTAIFWQTKYFIEYCYFSILLKVVVPTTKTKLGIPNSAPSIQRTTTDTQSLVVRYEDDDDDDYGDDDDGDDDDGADDDDIPPSNEQQPTHRALASGKTVFTMNIQMQFQERVSQGFYI